MAAEIIDLTLDGSDDVSNSALLYYDVNPSEILQPTTSPAKPQLNQPKLLLPAHVSVVGSFPVEIIAPEDQDSYVEYLDYGGLDEFGASIPRYFQLERDNSKAPSITVCKRCGAKGDHKTSSCPVIICLTCGVRDEHPTRSCPMSKVCFGCGMKGHLKTSCPNRGKIANTYDDCGRCGSESHATNECPTIWRIYDYASDTDRVKTLAARQAKKALPLGQGGEGYIAQDSWCYNCGDSGHWGDDCQSTPHVHDIPDEYSAFGLNNLSSGPFSEIESNETKRAPREWEVGSAEWNDWGGRVPVNVGRQAKKKEMDRMRAQKALYDDDDDDDDRFTFLAKPMRDGGDRDRRDSGRGSSGNGRKPPSQPKKMRLELSVKGAAKLEAGNHKPSIGRNGSDIGRSREDASRYSDRDRERNNHHREREKPRDRDKDRGRSGSSKKRREEERGPRYKGGYQ